MAHSYEGTTLALQHYYDIIGAPRMQTLMMIYPANEQPFGNHMSVWMASYSDDKNLPESTKHRLDEAMLKNRAVSDPHVLRVLDYGTSEGNSFVVTDALNCITLRSWLRSHEQLQTWQALRLLEQLTGIITSAHQAGFSDLCLSSDNIFIRDEARFEIQTGPLGIGLHRSEILKLRDVTITTDVMRHLPPWEFSVQPKQPKIQNSEAEESGDDIHHTSDESENEQTDESKSEVLTESESADPKKSEDSSREDSIQDLDPTSASIESSLNIPEAPEDLCPDVYALAAILYESLCGQHPYFSDSSELCDAALSIVQANPIELSRRIEISDEMSNVIMEFLRTPHKDSAPQLLANFAAQCSESDREKAREAEKCWLTPTQTAAPGKRQRRITPQFKHPFIAYGIAAAIIIIISCTLTWKVAQYREPVDLFALPELIPMAQDGVDVIIAPRTTASPDTKIYLTSLADGMLIPLGSLPYTYRKQEDGAKLSFVIADEQGHSMQLPVTVKGEQGTMFVPVELNW